MKLQTVFGILLFSIITNADNNLPSSINISASYSSPNAAVGMMMLDLGLRAGGRVSTVVNGSWASIENDENIKTSLISIGYSTDPLKTLSLGLEYERWGQPAVIQTETGRVPFKYSKDTFSFGITPELRSIAFFSQDPLTTIKRIYSTSYGVRPIVSMYLGSVFLQLTGAFHWYKNVPSNLDRLGYIGFVSSTTLSHTSGFLSRAANFRISKDWSNFTTGIELNYNLAYVDRTESYSGILRFDLMSSIKSMYSIGLGISQSSIGNSFISDFGYTVSF